MFYCLWQPLTPSVLFLDQVSLPSEKIVYKSQGGGRVKVSEQKREVKVAMAVTAVVSRNAR